MKDGMFEIIYMPAHDHCATREDGKGSCWCVKRGFKTYEEAEAYAMKHLLCNLCQEEMRLVNEGNPPGHLKGVRPGEYSWRDSACSAEWWIDEVEK